MDFGSNRVFGFVFATAPIWLPFTTFMLLYEHWLQYVRKKFDHYYGRTTLEIKIPQEIFKSPEAMEIMLTQLYQTGTSDNHKETYIDGKHPPVFGLELVSRGGDVKFYMNVPKRRFKNLTETQLYAQYPGIEVHELPIDYTAEIPWDPSRYFYFSLHFAPKKADAYPIKTYIDYGLDRMPKEEEKIDPINSMLEMLGSMEPQEHMWIQILISANREENFKQGALGLKPDWKADARKEVVKIVENARKRAGLKEPGGNDQMLLTEAEKDTIKAIERSVAKLAFNTTIRGIYICPMDNIRIGEQVPAMITAWRPYDELNRNAIGIPWRTDFDWNWWQDPSGKKRLHMKYQEIMEYKKREYTKQGPNDGPKVMTTEELATLFHFPGKVATTPSLGRIPSKRAEPPANLPIR